MLKVLPLEPKGTLMVQAENKWSALSQAMLHFFFEEITPEQYEEADRNDREENIAWWEDFIYSPYYVHNEGFAQGGGWLLPEPTNVENVWKVHSL